MPTLRFLAFGVLMGMIGFAIAWSAWHLYIDHQDLHALIQIEQVRRATGK